MEDLTAIIIGNACNLCASAADLISGTRKKRNQMLAIQIVSQLFFGAGALVLRGYSSTAQNVVAILRNVSAISKLRYKIVEWILIALGVILGVVGIILSHNAYGIFDWIPIAANLEYSIAVFRFRNNERALKLAFVINLLLFAVFDFVIKNYVGTAANVTVSTVILITLIKNRKKEADA